MQGKATEKDVRYALEYAGEKLIRTIEQGKPKATYTLSPSNKIVTEHVVNSLASEGLIRPSDPGLFPDDYQSYEWSGR